MTPLTVLATSALELLADDAPLDLNARLKAETGRVGPRRVSRFVRLALLGARRCVGATPLPSSTAVYLTSNTGPVADTAELLVQAATGQPLPPVRFVNVSSNMVSYYLAAELGLQGSNQVVMSRDLAWFSLLETAWFNLPPGGTALVGAVEECAWPLAAHRQRLGLPATAALADSSHWLLLRRGAGGTPGDGTVITQLARLSNDAAARQWLASAPRNAALTLSPMAASGVGQDCPVHTDNLEASNAANGLADAAAGLAWLSRLSGRAYLLDRSASGRWGVIQSQPEAP